MESYRKSQRKKALNCNKNILKKPENAKEELVFRAAIDPHESSELRKDDHHHLGASGNAGSQKKTFTKDSPRIMEVAGINYILTMEPPGSSRNRKSCKNFKEFEPKEETIVKPPEPTDDVEENYEDLDEEIAMLDKITKLKLLKAIPGITGHQLDEWFEQRLNKSKDVNITNCGARDIVDPVKVEALDHAALRLRNLVLILINGVNLSKDVMCQNLEYSISVLESSFLKSNRKTGHHPAKDEEILESISGEAPVPQEIKSWLVETFSRKRVGPEKKPPEADRQRFRTVVKAVQAGMLFDKIFRKSPLGSENTLPIDVEEHLQNVDRWTYNILELEHISTGNALRYICYQLLTKYDLLRKFKIAVPVLISYCNRLQRGYRKHSNRYHNPCHAADVAQTLNCLLVHSGLINWLTDLEIFSMIMAALVHDVEHTGTTNNYHINTRSHLATLYNDRSVLENHHVSTAFRILQEEGCNILSNFSREDYQDCRSLMIEMVLATDMNQHFEQIKHTETASQCPELMEKSKVMCLMIHSSDINHPSKPWKLHYQWTEKLMFEFFDQGDRERELNLPMSPLCDRHSARVAESQIGFIDFVVQPTFSVLFHVLDEVNSPTVRSAIESAHKPQGDSIGEVGPMPNDVLKIRFCDSPMSDVIMKHYQRISKNLAEFKELCLACMAYNKTHWMKKNAVEKANSLLGEDAFREEGSIVEDPIPPLIEDDQKRQTTKLELTTESGSNALYVQPTIDEE